MDIFTLNEYKMNEYNTKEKSPNPSAFGSSLTIQLNDEREMD